jgi:type II secretory pathway component GspD/PulD (secretin)
VVLGSTAALAQQAIQPGQMPPLPLTQLDNRRLAADLDNRTFTLTFAQPVSIKDLLLLLVRGTSLSLVPDPNIEGSFIGELKNVTVRQALGLILPPLGLEYALDGSVVRVFKREPETRLFDVNVTATDRAGSSLIVGGEPSRRSFASVSSSTKSDVFNELTKGVQTLLSERATFSVDRKAGLLQVTDFPERLDRVALYLDAVQDRVHRQAQIDARVIEVELTDEKAPGVDWTAVAAQLVGDLTPAQRAAPRPSLTGLRVSDLTKLMSLLASQGKVTMIASPRLLALNNEPAIVRTDSLTVSVTPQISGDGIVTLALSPIVKGPAVAESDMLARVADGETLVVWGFTRDREIRERKNVGVTGGWFGRGTVVTHKKVELVILLTPKIVTGVAVP